MASSKQNPSLQPRSSTETDRRHLLAESIAPSETASTISIHSGERTPRAQSPTQPDNPKPYKGFPSEADYLAALREWAESKKYIQHDTTMTGFYGTTTMEELASRPPVELGLKRKWKARKARKEERRNENTT